MGYRSDVRIRLTKEDYERLKEEFEKTIVTKFGFNLFDDMAVYKEEKGYGFYTEDENNDCVWKEKDCVYFGWNCVKWYDGYDDVDSVMDFIENCKQYAFIRIGESCEGDIDAREKDFDMIGFYYAFDDDEGGIV